MNNKVKMNGHAYISLYTLTVLFMIFLAILIAVDSPLSMIHNIFYSHSENTNLAISKNSDRVTKALDYVYSFPSPMIHTPRNILEFELDLLVVIVTVSRNWGSDYPGYLLQTAAGMDILMKKDKYFARKFMFICNVDKDPKEHIDAVKLKDYLPYVQKNGTNNMGLTTIPVTPMRNTGLKEFSRKKEISDYAFCLQVSKQFNFKYVLMLEDDVIPYDNMFQVLDHTMKYRIPVQKFNEDHDDRDFTFLKLYYPLMWQGYAWETVPILELISLGTIGGMIFLLVSLIPSENKRTSPKQLKPSLVWPFLCGIIVSILIANILGRSYMMDIRRLSPYLFRFGRSSGCCTQAMLYKKDKIQQICDHILVDNSLNKDLAIYDLTQTTGIPGYQIEPNLFQHIGMFTSLSSSYKEPEAYIFDTQLFD